MKTPPFVEVFQRVGSELREPTSEELQEAEAIRIELALLDEQIGQLETRRNEVLERCKHTVCYDQRGYEWDIRTCYACGAGMGAV